MKKSKFTVPKGYKGISNDIVLEFNTQLAVITGLNGCGKSTMLKYLYENYPDRSKCFIKTPQTIDFNEKRRVSAYRGGVRYSDDVSFDSVMQDIESDRKSTRLNSSHVRISYAVFCLKKKKKTIKK